MKKNGFVILDFDCPLPQYTLQKVHLLVCFFLLEIEQCIVPFYDLQYVHVHRT